MKNSVFHSTRKFGAATRAKAGALLATLLVLLSCETEEVTPIQDENAVFLSFSANQQTLPASISSSNRVVRLEVGHATDVSQLAPTFNVPEGFSVFANGVEQVSGVTPVNFSKPVRYELRNQKNNSRTSWEVSVTTVGCKILIDASHDGGGWWFPQSPQTGFNPNAWHQGQPFANELRKKGFEVTELGRGFELKEEMFFGNYIVIRVGGFESYTSKELEVYSNLLQRGMNLAFFTDHKRHDPVDELGDLLGLEFRGIAYGNLKTFAPHGITTNLVSLNYLAGSVIMNASQNPSLEILGWLGTNEYADLNFNGVHEPNEPVSAPVMGILKHPTSRIFFIGDTNSIEMQPQPFIDNLIGWMGDCSAIP